MGKAHWDYACFNPPFQSTVGGTKNIDIWPVFIDATNQIADSSCIVHPGRWVIPKKQMKPVHDKIMKDGLVAFDYYEHSDDVFPGKTINGGITMTVFKNGYTGDVQYYNEGRYKGTYTDSGIFFTNDFEKEAYEKIHAKTSGPSLICRMLGNPGSLGGGEFGYKKHEMIQYLTDDVSSLKNPIKIWANSGFGTGTRFAWHYIDKSVLRHIPAKLFTSRKVMVDKKGHAIGASSSADIICNVPQVVPKDVTASGDVLFFFPEKDDDYDLNLIKSLLMTKTARFLMSIAQKDVYARGFENVPDYTLFISMLHGQLFTDSFFYTTFGFSQELIQYIEAHISEKKE